MNEQFFVKQSYKNVKVAFAILFICFFIVTIIGMIKNQQFYLGFAMFLVAMLILFTCLTKLFDSYGIYVVNGKLFYKTIKKREIDIKSIVAVRVIKSEAQVNLAWSTFDMKDKKGHSLYSMIFLSEIKDGMGEYPYGDIEFLRKYKKSVVMYSVYSKELIEFLTKNSANVKILGMHS